MRELQQTWGQDFFTVSLPGATAGFVLTTLVPSPLSEGKVWTFRLYSVVSVIFLDKPPRRVKNGSHHNSSLYCV